MVHDNPPNCAPNTSVRGAGTLLRSVETRNVTKGVKRRGKEPDFPGGLIPNHALQGTGEWAYGITEWWEMGFYTPYAVDEHLTPYSNAAKIRQLFVIPNAAEREFFYGVNFEISYAMPQFSDTQWNLEIRPIVGWRMGD